VVADLTVSKHASASLLLYVHLYLSLCNSGFFGHTVCMLPRSQAEVRPYLRRSGRGLRSPGGLLLAVSPPPPPPLAAAAAAPATTAAAPAAALTPSGWLDATLPLWPSPAKWLQHISSGCCNGSAATPVSAGNESELLVGMVAE
jgi:hypothetical protein